jgi:hypothetical protein
MKRIKKGLAYSGLKCDRTTAYLVSQKTTTGRDIKVESFKVDMVASQ